MNTKTKLSFSAIIVTLAVLFALAVCAAAESRYSPDQYYVQDDTAEKVYTVQFSAGEVLQGAEKNRDTMLSCGYDAFVYKEGNLYCIMSGKFRSYADANKYRSELEKVKGAEDGYITYASLPTWAVTEFETVYYGNMPSIFLDQPEKAGVQANTANPLINDYYTDRSDLGWSISVPSSFRLYTEGDGFRTYYNYNYDMAVRVSWESVAASSAQSYERILSADYNAELRKHREVTYDALHDDYYTATGYDGDYIFYVRGILKNSRFYHLEFYYPTVNRYYCDPTLESIRDSFKG